MHLVPRPATLNETAGTWRLTETTGVLTGPGAAGADDLLRDLLGHPTGYALRPAAGPGPDTIALHVDPDLGREAYRLSVGDGGVTATGGDLQGLRHAVQTLRQMLPIEIFAAEPPPAMEWTVPYAEIEDAPRFGWRGVLVDVARHWFPLEFLFRMVDLAALHKLNVLHLHLTDDQGWRMEIERYPRLTEVGAWRAESMLGHLDDDRDDDRYDGVPHGGFYTKRELRALVAHAEERGVTIVPEIDMPGHMTAAIAAYPELGDDPADPPAVWTRWGINDRVLNVEEETIAFFQGVLEEVLEVFPSPWIHLGGDECPKKEWNASPRARQRMRELGLPDAAALQNWFMGRMAAFLAERGRRVIGWDEILEAELPADATVMSWRGEEGGIAAATAGHGAIMCPYSHLYLDFYQADPENEPLAIGGLTTLETVYGYDPAPAGLAPETARHILGAQANLWSEYMPDARQVEYMAFPRLCALAEVAWGTTGEFAEFTGRLEGHLRRLDHLGVHYHR
ncbi:beta-N-acetylhexosaminidase [Spirillospora sp. CA-253888]